MEFGIIAEGRGDCAVLENILIGLFDLEGEDIRFFRPSFSRDNTDKGTYRNMSEEEFGSWTLVKKDCEEQHHFRNFFNNPIAGERYMIVQIDTAECEEKGYDVKRPDKKAADYCDTLRNLVIDKINEWLEDNWAEEVCYAICIEEMEAWIHTLYENKDTSIPLQAKETFQKYFQKQRIKNKKIDKVLRKLQQKSEFDKANFLSKGFRKNKKLQNALDNNRSLQAFVVSLEDLKL